MNNRPFAETLQALLDERDWSQRELSRRLEAELGREDKIASSTIRLYFTGDMHPTRSAMERIAKVLRVSPNHFAEYRLEVVRDALNWRLVGTRKAVRSLERLRR